jgi:hypothetical protein
MFYRFLIVLMFLCSGIVSAASSAEKVYRITYVQKSDKWYKEQAMLWKKILQADESNEQAWMNYYYANRYAHLDVDSHFDENKQQRLDDILAEIKKHIPDTYTYYYISALNAQNINEFDINALEYAHHRWPEKPDILYELILYHEVKGNKEKVLLYSRELYESQDIARGLLEYNANMLLSVKPGSILFTNGDNDTYPALVLQNAHSFQSNILVINIHMAFSYREYLSRLLADNNMIIDVDKLSEQNITRFFSEFVAVLSEKYPKKNICLKKIFIWWDLPISIVKSEWII